AALRDRALRPLFAGRRVGVRPPVPVGLQAHRARPGARRRPLLGRLAPRAPDRPARGGAGVQHAGLPVARRRGAGRRGDRRAHEGAAADRRPLHRRADRQGAGGSRRQDRTRRRGRLPAGPRQARTARELTWVSKHVVRNRHPHPDVAARGPVGLGLAAAQESRLRGSRSPGAGRRGAAGMSTGWSLFVAVLAAINILGCVWLLWWNSQRRPGDPKPEDAGHYWDGDITEYNKPMPRWWINGFYIAIVFGVGYLMWYGGLGTFEGMGRWSSQNEHALAKAAADARLEETFS